MFRQYCASPFRRHYPLIPRTVRGKTVFYSDPRDKQIGTIPAGTILYIQEGINPLRGFTRPFVCREPWIVEAWLPREYAKWHPPSRTFQTVFIRGGHLARVRSLRNNRVKEVAETGSYWRALTRV